MISEAIILAGGLGTRLRSVVQDTPKCLAPVNGRPFLHYLITHLRRQGIEHLIFSLGYLGNQVEAYLASVPALSYTVVTEPEPLGTGGAIRLACTRAQETDLLVCNGDTLFQGDIRQLADFHRRHQAACTLALKPLQHFDRYGVVVTDAEGRVVSFREKQYYEQGLINAGVYVLNRPGLLSKPFPERFSFEKDYLEKEVAQGRIFGLQQDAYFIDIGIPEDFNRAQEELSRFD